MKPKVAIVCDWLVSRGGAERVISAMAGLYPEAPIYTAIYDERRLPEFSKRQVITSFIQKLPFARERHPWYLPIMPYAFEQFDLSEFDIVLSSSHSCAKGIITKPQTLHISYCHSPMRYAWENCHRYFEQYGIPWLLQGPAQHMLHKIRLWDRVSADRVDFFIANSEHVQRRIQKYYRREATVIYPPVETSKFAPQKPREGEGRFFLSVGRLTTYKRFDLLIDTFNDLKLPLVVVGSGKDEKELKKAAGRFITFIGSISDEELQNVYARAMALVFPQQEDFGITPLEAMSAGKPVIAYAEGGALETVIPGKTGLLFENQTKNDLKRAILEFGAMKWNSEVIRKHARTFDRSLFEAKFQKEVEEKWMLWKK